MGSIRARKESGKLYFDFRYKNKRCREQTNLSNTTANKRQLNTILSRIEAEITLGNFEYANYFPNSPLVQHFSSSTVNSISTQTDTPIFSSFVPIWLNEMKIQWRNTHYEAIKSTFEIHISPFFGDMLLGEITKAQVLEFRASLGALPGRKNQGLSPERINHILTPLRMLLNEAADRYNFVSPYRNIKSLKVPKTEVQPFTLNEVTLILDNVRSDYHSYFTTRFFTGMRSSEINGLKWKYVDFKNRQILIREAYVKGDTVYTKTDDSQREIYMSQPVFDALQKQKEATGSFAYVFCNGAGNPLDNNNFTNRVWHPLLRYLKLDARRPYQTRHTAATLWLAAGENPEWIAHQMGHSTTEMLFRVYSRYVPNLTRQDGSAFERVLSQHLNNDEGENSE